MNNECNFCQLMAISLCSDLGVRADIMEIIVWSWKLIIIPAIIEIIISRSRLVKRKKRMRKWQSDFRGCFVLYKNHKCDEDKWCMFRVILFIAAVIGLEGSVLSDFEFKKPLSF